MKRIDKKSPPQSFAKWVKRTKPKNWDFRDSKPVYDELSEDLRKEQGNLCCYCEQELIDGKVHIEHYKERSRHPSEIFNYTNLHACCNGDEPKNRVDKHCCGRKRGSIPHTNILSPLLENIEQMFSYDLQGKMKASNPTNQQIVESTINTLGLNCDKLVRLRCRVFETLLLETKDKTEDEVKMWISEKLAKDSEGHYTEFWTVVDYFFGSRAEESPLRKGS